MTQRERPIVTWLLNYFVNMPLWAVLPHLSRLAELYPGSVHLTKIDTELRWMVANGIITRRTGTVRENRGHAAIRVIATGRVLKTAGCPFEPPEPRTGSTQRRR